MTDKKKIILFSIVGFITMLILEFGMCSDHNLKHTIINMLCLNFWIVILVSFVASIIGICTIVDKKEDKKHKEKQK